MRTVLSWIASHLLLYAIICASISALLIVTEFRMEANATVKRFVLFPMPSWDPRRWFVIAGVFLQHYPWMTTGLFILPLSALFVGLVARIVTSVP